MPQRRPQSVLAAKKRESLVQLAQAFEDTLRVARQGLVDKRSANNDIVQNPRRRPVPPSHVRESLFELPQIPLACDNDDEVREFVRLQLREKILQDRIGNNSLRAAAWSADVDPTLVEDAAIAGLALDEALLSLTHEELWAVALTLMGFTPSQIARASGMTRAEVNELILRGGMRIREQLYPDA